MKADFYTEVYNIVREIPEGCVVTYGQLAKLARRPQCSRMVGQAMFNVPKELNLPCHRVVNSQGRLAPNWAEQRGLLEKEGITFKKNGCVDFTHHIWSSLLSFLSSYSLFPFSSPPRPSSIFKSVCCLKKKKKQK